MMQTLDDAERKIRALEARELLFRQTLEQAADIFREYAALHLAKGPEHHAKAKRDLDVAARIEYVLKF